MDIKLIAMDLDGTLLDRDKNLTPENKWALERAASLGIHIVPATGRYFDAMPESVRSLPFIRYAITINGACVIDHETGEVIYEADMPLEEGLRVLDHFESLGVAHDCYIGSKGYMDRHYIDNIENYISSPGYCKTVREFRSPVDDLRSFIEKSGKRVQKVQMFTKDKDLLLSEYSTLAGLFPDLVATSSLTNNLELNAREATKGRGLKALAARLCIDLKQVMAFGDGGNDYEMLMTAGVSVTMGNGLPRLKKISDLVTLTNNGSGVAYAINRLLF